MKGQKQSFPMRIKGICGNGGMAPLIPYVRTRWSRVGRFTLRPLYPFLWQPNRRGEWKTNSQCGHLNHFLANKNQRK